MHGFGLAVGEDEAGSRVQARYRDNAKRDADSDAFLDERRKDDRP
jgi:hypothetical protein